MANQVPDSVTCRSSLPTPAPAFNPPDPGSSSESAQRLAQRRGRNGAKACESLRRRRPHSSTNETAQATASCELDRCGGGAPHHHTTPKGFHRKAQCQHAVRRAPRWESRTHPHPQTPKRFHASRCRDVEPRWGSQTRGGRAEPSVARLAAGNTGLWDGTASRLLGSRIAGAGSRVVRPVPPGCVCIPQPGLMRLQAQVAEEGLELLVRFRGRTYVLEKAGDQLGKSSEKARS